MGKSFFNSHLFNPFKTLAYLEDYFESIRVIHQDRQLQRDLWFAKLNLFFQAVHLFASITIPMSDWAKWAIFEKTAAFNVPLVYNHATLPIVYMAWVFLNRLYYENNNNVTDLVEEVVIRQKNHRFLIPNFRNKPASVYIRKICVKALRINQIVVLALG